MPLTLTVLRGPHQGRRIPVRVPEFLIGRDPLCHLRPSSKDVHWQHCAIVSREVGAYLRDDSRQGNTFLNRRQLRGGEMELADGDRIAVGPLEFVVTVDSNSEISEILGSVQARPGAPETRSHPPTVARLEATPPSIRPAFIVKPMKDCREILCST